jgi:hypothetical protein
MHYLGKTHQAAFPEFLKKLNASSTCLSVCEGYFVFSVTLQ